MEISRELFDEQRCRRFGNDNPQRMQLAFWEWMIRRGEEAMAAQEGLIDEFGLVQGEGNLRPGYGAWCARDHFKIPMYCEDEPIWTFDRIGATRTTLPTGHVVCIGGEHEDDYDPDFCIYNDVVVFGPGDEIAIFGYPKESFPPTDFHTATLIGERIFIIGCHGYPDGRRTGHTPVYELDLSDYQISPVEASGQMPGWLFKHEAELGSDALITVRGGEVFVADDGGGCFWRNNEEYALDIRSGVWRQVTSRNWGQFFITPENTTWFMRERWPEAKLILPLGMGQAVPCEEKDVGLMMVQEVLIAVSVDINGIRIIVKGRLPGELSLRIAEEVRRNTESVLECPCDLRQM